MTHLQHLFPRHYFVGFDRLFDEIESMMDQTKETYPPHNIINDGENRTIVELAVAGFSKDDIDISLVDQHLTITGVNTNKREEVKYAHRGISSRKFKKVIRLSDYVEVVGADLTNGILSIYLERVVPDHMKPRKIEIGYEAPQQLLLEDVEEEVAA